MSATWTIRLTIFVEADDWFAAKQAALTPYGVWFAESGQASGMYGPHRILGLTIEGPPEPLATHREPPR
jgi:hypothetical protein